MQKELTDLHTCTHQQTMLKYLTQNSRDILRQEYCSARPPFAFRPRATSASRFSTSTTGAPRDPRAIFALLGCGLLDTPDCAQQCFLGAEKTISPGEPVLLLRRGCCPCLSC